MLLLALFEPGVFVVVVLKPRLRIMESRSDFWTGLDRDAENKSPGACVSIPV